MPDLTMTEEGFIQADADVRLYFRHVGEGPAVVIPLACWTEEFDVLARGRRVIFYDPRNRGQSTAVAIERISFANDIGDLEAVRRHFGLDKISLIGWSYFGGVVARYAMEYPERVERLVMVGGPPIRRVPHNEAVNRIMVERLNAVAPGFFQAMMAKTTHEPEEMRRFWELLRETRTGKKPARAMRGDPARFENEKPEKVAAVFLRAHETQGDWDWREDAKRVKCPALYVYGTEDYLPFAAAQEWAECLPNARVFKMEGVGHFPSLEEPERFFAGLEEFLGGG